jgi:hypothetical protein
VDGGARVVGRAGEIVVRSAAGLPCRWPGRGGWLLAACLLAAPHAVAQGGAGNVVFVPTPQSVVERMLEMARVGKADRLIDLGSGDGRIVITAAKRHGASGLGVDLDPVLVEQAGRNAAREGVADRARFERRDLFLTDLRGASVVTAYLHPAMLIKLRPRLLRELEPGARIVSHDYHFGDWPPDASETLKVPEKKVGKPGISYVYLWTVPANVHGLWNLTVEQPGAAPRELALVQEFQRIEGVLRLSAKPVQLVDARLDGPRIRFSAVDAAAGRHEFDGRVRGAAMEGEVTVAREGKRATLRWTASRLSPLRPLDGAS